MAICVGSDIFLFVFHPALCILILADRFSIPNNERACASVNVLVVPRKYVSRNLFWLSLSVVKDILSPVS